MEMSGLEQTTLCLVLIHRWHDCPSPRGVLSLWKSSSLLEFIFSLPGHQSQRFAGTDSDLLYSRLLLLSSPDF